MLLENCLLDLLDPQKVYLLGSDLKSGIFNKAQGTGNIQSVKKGRKYSLLAKKDYN